MKTLNRSRPQELFMGNIVGGLVTIINPIRTVFAITISFTTGIISYLVANTPTIIGSIMIGMIVYMSPYEQYSDNILSELKVTQQNIPYILKDAQNGKIIAFVDEVPSNTQVFETNGTLLPSEGDSGSLVVEHKGSLVMEHKPVKKRNTKIKTLKDLNKNVSKSDYDEVEEDATYVRQNLEREREAMRVRINNKNCDSE